MIVNFQRNLKELAENLPEPLARLAAKVPFSVRLGPTYARTRRSIERLENFDSSEHETWSSLRLYSIVKHAKLTIPFYDRLYAPYEIGDGPSISKTAFSKLPIIDKSDLRSTSIKDRVSPRIQNIKTNTGGTSGSPLEFSLDHSAFAREWAHMHWIWRKAGYRTTDVKITFRGRISGESVLRYNAVHNEYWVNANKPMTEVVLAIRDLLRTKPVRWIHGYPSLISEFARVLEIEDVDTHSKLRSQLSGVLLGSEYPAPPYRDQIERVLSRNCVSWYGHSEMAVLAWESARGVYEPLPSYGYTEVIPDTTDPTVGRLVVTSFDNLSHPFIRYDTGDRVRVVSGQQGKPAFSILEGRVGDFILDQDKRRVSLTALIFGRHHEAFGQIEHVQVVQSTPGRATLLVVPKVGCSGGDELLYGFDLSGVAVDWDFEIRSSPVRSALGKIRLLVGDPHDSN